MGDTAAPAAPARQKVWDAPTRLVHWLFALLVAFSWWTAEERHMQWHFWSGLAIAGLLVFRIYWGFAGPETARFARFLKGPGDILGSGTCGNGCLAEFWGRYGFDGYPALQPGDHVTVDVEHLGAMTLQLAR